MRVYGAEAVTLLICEALNFDHKPPLVANAVGQHLINLYLLCLTVFALWLNLTFLEECPQRQTDQCLKFG